MRELFNRIGQNLMDGRDAVLVTVVATSGAVPRGAGARMLVTEKGRAYGTIGGGVVEYRCEQMAKDVLKSGGARTEAFRLYPNDVADLGAICGGDMEVYFQYIAKEDSEMKALMERIRNFYQSGEQFWLICERTEGHMSVYGAKSGLFGRDVPEELLSRLGRKPERAEMNGKQYYAELILRPGRVFIFGGGHVAQALVPALAGVDFRCVVLEDRPEFIRSELFPCAEETRLVDVSDLSGFVSEIGKDDYICIMTRGHKDDFEVQSQVMKTQARYIGVIGSVNKQRVLKEKLLASGYKEEDFKNVVSPIGLKIGSQTPEEIAISITAQMIMVRAGLLESV